ncbi:Kinesin-like protein [Quillaja saponaria]|uniref:Kinesin-like protein n=1 Tax=Quillaja saponaria TaxID=32244 RepID=A0AAD7QBM9_QUISA|nr:Kinesin-like protein [Quillaja saponaria]
MGAISGEELTKWEKMQGVGGREEKILVLVRLRPLNEKEITSNEAADWECINDTTILYRNTLREGSTFPSAYTFDRVFRGDCSTEQVYEEGAKQIALSVVSGINSSIFAYGQTSSGKTYTMVGITEYTVAEIFDYIHMHEERAYVLKFSAIEIYNEVVRDLLCSDNTPLRLLDDPERGTIVEKVKEEILRDWGHLKELLSICEAQRQIGETSLNEKSSRSHQIIRLTIESSAREFLGKDNSTTLAATVNFVDLAGSERASQSLSAGTRLKEGCHINRSLLTLGTVIRKLSKGRHGHINYRDSKLTRILQPCLGGNARTAIICTLSPARSHVEQTRNTLLFACCAKEVTTKAQVNVVMSDKALVRHLQKELARLESELRTPGPATSTCDYAALLRKKDLQIQKMEKEIRELTKQRDLAQSRAEDLLRMVANDQDSRQDGDTWEDDCSASESSSMPDPRLNVGIRKFNNPHYNGEDARSNPEEAYHQLQENADDISQSDGDPDDYCKEVRCVEMEESRGGNSGYLALSTSENGMSASTWYGDGNVTGQETRLAPVNGDREVSQTQNNIAYGALEQRLHDVQMTIGSLVNPNFDEQSSQAKSENMSNTSSLKLTRSWSCRGNLMTDSPDIAGDTESTPPNGFEKGFLGRPESFGQRIPPLNYGANGIRLSRNDSQSSVESASQSIKTSADEEITSVHTFVAGLKEMAKLEYEKQLVDGQIKDTENGAPGYGKNFKDVGVDPMLGASETSLDWPLEFEKQQKAIVELWNICSVSLIHRTYFFLLFKGDPADSIYMEVELRRLSFLKETFSNGNQAVRDGHTVTLASSKKALGREREILIKLMKKRLSEEERKRLFRRWGIALDSKRRRLQLVNLLWSNTQDMNHITESAAVVAKLVRFVEQGQALKEMFGLSFTPPQSKRRSYGWKNSKASLL